MNKKVFKIIFIAFALLAFFAAIYHINGFFHPTQITPAWRHGIFIAVNIICIYGLLKRPNWFIWFVGLLSLQQLYSHGSYAIEIWKTTHQIHWISIGVVISMPLLFVCLILERKFSQ